MLDIQFIRQHEQELQEAAKLKGINISIAKLLEKDQQRRHFLQQADALRAKRNEKAQRITTLLSNGQQGEAEQLKREVRLLNQQIKQDDSKRRDLESEYHQLMLQVPNMMSPDTPKGESDQDNVELRKVGIVPSFSYVPKDHMTLGENLGLIDVPRGVKVAGSRSFFLKGFGFHLQRAVQQIAIDVLMKKGFTFLDVPTIVNEESLYHTGFFPDGREQTYSIEKEEKHLIGTAEIPLVSYYSGEIIDVAQPIQLAAVSNCYRKEAGSAGRDVHGLYRVHQFTKVEQVILCEADVETSNRLHEELTSNAEEILQLLELPYRVVAVCSGDMGQKNYKQYDIETWMPSRQAYGETHSSSNVLDFQARRSNLRYKDKNGEVKYCFTLNNTGISSPRILIPLLENHQQEDGSIYIPKALRRYMNDMEFLLP
ncbi:serine--tRNA ligase [Bacillus horti]|uniref:Serine--tRNA ligase n=1 Tax=Caldalkalibacillus horti TaxID=77523 RepID=A0ABT9W308_9BACI|nr:serine--tRNA ligase [Bacillus horti]MDQ0167621.1 seryl-tRNA synthetase [Bacillus horti]